MKKLKLNMGALRQMQHMSLGAKIRCTRTRIKEWYNEYNGNVYVSFSGGKDSAVLVDIARDIYSDIPVYYIDTGLEWPEVRKFALNKVDKDHILKPEINFRDVLCNYGYPLISKEVSQKINGARKGQKSALRSFDGSREPRYDYSRWAFLIDAPFKISSECCNRIKKNPAKTLEKEKGLMPIVATLAEESSLRTQKWLENGCNAYKSDRPISKPMSFWTEQDILRYIKKYNLDIASVYGKITEKNALVGQTTMLDCMDILGMEYNVEDYDFKCSGCSRTGCIYCAYGCHLDKRPNRFELMDIMSNPTLRDFCLRGGHFVDGLWQPDGIGLGFWFVLQYLNVHGNTNIYIPEYERYLLEYGTEETYKFL